MGASPTRVGAMSAHCNSLLSCLKNPNVPNWKQRRTDSMCLANVGQHTHPPRYPSSQCLNNGQSCGTCVLTLAPHVCKRHARCPPRPQAPTPIVQDHQFPSSDLSSQRLAHDVMYLGTPPMARGCPTPTCRSIAIIRCLA